MTQPPGLTNPLPHITQQDDNTCGPAVIQLLLSHLHRSFTQDQITAAANLTQRRLEEWGTSPQEMAMAVNKLAPDLQLSFKQFSSWTDLDFLLHKYHWPVGINWQGLFYDSIEEEALNDPNGDHGHYSVVTDINLHTQEIIIYDPYSEYSSKPRVFSLSWFKDRWWDINEDSRTKQLIFIVTSVQAHFPKVIGMTPSIAPV